MRARADLLFDKRPIFGGGPQFAGAGPSAFDDPRRFRFTRDRERIDTFRTGGGKGYGPGDTLDPGMDLPTGAGALTYNQYGSIVVTSDAQDVESLVQALGMMGRSRTR